MALARALRNHRLDSRAMARMKSSTPTDSVPNAKLPYRKTRASMV